MIRAIVVLLAVLAAHAQTTPFVVISERNAVTSDKVTIATNSAAPSTVDMLAAVVQASVGGTLAVEVSGSAATSAPATPSPTNPGSTATARAKAFTASNVGNGTPVTIAYKFAANTPFRVDLDHIRMSSAGSTVNVTVKIVLDSAGDCKTAVYFKETF